MKEDKKIVTKCTLSMRHKEINYNNCFYKSLLDHSTKNIIKKTKISYASPCLPGWMFVISVYKS